MENQNVENQDGTAQDSEKKNEDMVKAIYEHAAHLMVHEGKTASQTIDVLVSEGLDKESASIVVTNLAKEITDAKKNRAQKDIIFGALWLVGGTIVTVATYSAASGGGRYVVAWGAIVFGAVQLIKGLANSSSASS